MRKRRRLIVWVASAVVLLTLLGLGFLTQDSPGRVFVFLARNADCYRQPQEHGLAAIGDSITAGSSKPGVGFLPRDSWFGQAVCETDLPFTFNGGIANQTTEQIVARLPDVLSHKPAVVTIYAGTNDVYLDDLSDASVDRLRKMITEVRLSGAVPVIATLPPIHDKPTESVAFNTLIRELAATEHVRLLDFYPVLADGAEYKPGFGRDGLHPSVVGAEAMAKLAGPVLEGAYSDWERANH